MVQKVPGGPPTPSQPPSMLLVGDEIPNRSARPAKPLARKVAPGIADFDKQVEADLAAFKEAFALNTSINPSINAIAKQYASANKQLKKLYLDVEADLAVRSKKMGSLEIAVSDMTDAFLTRSNDAPPE